MLVITELQKPLPTLARVWTGTSSLESSVAVVSKLEGSHVLGLGDIATRYEFHTSQCPLCTVAFSVVLIHWIPTKKLPWERHVLDAAGMGVCETKSCPCGTCLAGNTDTSYEVKSVQKERDRVCLRYGMQEGIFEEELKKVSVWNTRISEGGTFLDITEVTAGISSRKWKCSWHVWNSKKMRGLK